jgi:hypothetical protein
MLLNSRMNFRQKSLWVYANLVTLSPRSPNLPGPAREYQDGQPSISSAYISEIKCETVI